MKTFTRFFGLCVLLLAAVAVPVYSQNLTLDAAIDEAASYFIPRLSSGVRVALVHFEAPTGRLSDYIFDEMWKRFEDSKKFVMVDRRNTDRIEAEIRYQLETGRVNDDQVVSITKQHGAQILIYGVMNSFGQEYRLTITTTEVEKASSSQRPFTVRSDNRLASLLISSPDDEVERAVSVMARTLDRRTTITIGRIIYAGTQTVSSLSSWLKNGIITNAQKQREKFQVATEGESSNFAVATRGMTVETPVVNTNIQAVISGTYSPLDNGAEVSLQLISTQGNKAILASQKFFIPAAELDRRKLSLLPPEGNTVINKASFEAKQQAVIPYSGTNNKWAFTITPDVLDGIYYDGDYMTMQIYSERDCYFRIMHVDVNGITQIIYPASENDNNFIRAGQTRRIPDNTRYRMHQPFGEEMILASGYDQPFSPNQQSGTVPFSAAAVTRGMTVEKKGSGSPAGNNTMTPSVTAKFSYTILPRM